MSNVSSPSDFSNIKDLQTLIRFLSQFIGELEQVVNGNIEFDKNLLTQIVSATFVSANASTGINHKFGRKGLRYIVADKNVACDIYHDSTKDTSAQIFLKSTAANANVTLILF